MHASDRLFAGLVADAGLVRVAFDDGSVFWMKPDAVPASLAVGVTPHVASATDLVVDAQIARWKAADAATV